MKIFITSKDDNYFERIFEPESRFVFFTVADKIYYHDTTFSPEKLWVTTIDELSKGTDKLGENHRKMLKEALSITSEV